MMEPRGALFREIHKNTWLRRLSGDGKRPSVLAKKADRYWVVFCVHDDCEAFLEGYVDPRQAPSHSPEWSLSLQTVQHISHALVPVEQEFEFVITLSTDVARFNANTWECMQEWVDSLRSKLREMKLLSPKENLYSKLPEIRPPLAPTRDPTSPLPATPPVPAAIVPGIERIQPISLQLHHPTPTSSQPSSITPVLVPTTSTAPNISSASSSATHVPPITAMSNTSTQNLMNLLTNPLQAVSSLNNQHISSQHLFDAISLASSDLSDASLDEYSSELIKRFISSNSPLASPPPSTVASTLASSSSGSAVAGPSTSSGASNLGKPQKPVKENVITSGSSGASSSLATTFVNNVLADPGTTSLKRTDKKVLVDVRAEDFAADDSGSDEEADASNSSGTGTTSSSSSSRSSSSSSGSSSNYGCGSSEGSNRSDRARRIGTESGNESSLLSTAPASTSQSLAGERITTTSSSSFSKARHANRDDPKRTRRKSGNKSSSKSSTNVTIIQVSNGSSDSESPVKLLASPKPQHRTKPELVTKLSNGSTLITDDLSDDNYKSNVQIIPSNVEYDHHVSLPDHHNQEPSIIASINDRQITTVKVPNLVVNGSSSSSNSGSSNNSSNVTISSTSVSTAQPTVISTIASSSTPIKSDSNFGTVTQISVNSPCDRSRTPPQQHQHYEQVFLLSSPIQVVSNLDQPTSLQSPLPIASGSSAATKLNKSKITLLSKQQRSSSHSEIQLNRVRQLRSGQGNKENQGEGGAACSSGHKSGILPSASSPAVPSGGGNLSPSKRAPVDKNIYTPQPQRPMLQRGLTEMVISRSTNAVVAGGRDPARGRQPTAQQTADKFRNEINEQRRRSSSTSDAQPETSVNPVMRARLNGASRLQSPPQPFRPHHQLINQLDSMNGSNRKLTLREQQVMQLRREMMHPGGVRLQLRRKDCINSIGLVDAFGAVWVAGWKQKEHPVLYNALHIGDQLISVAGLAISSAAEAHKAIRGAPGLFVELIIRRVPFGRVYAIRRELDGQCLGLIRDGNTSTIVDVVPNSLTARHGLPPKAQSCDGLSLTFWVLTEINGRPLNLFFKDNEIRDRLNAVGRDISILVQPADLVTKLKKQLKSLRGHKDFIVQ
ncbi:serine-rich adhesin for platelets [Armigeres subalbatus]|uniref:serine-rich adhesin for platelets n=1 Tax=Armigeres subalbatus TaxID=124917 RepID=UPI002ED4BBA2